MIVVKSRRNMVTIGIDFGTTKTMAAWVNPKTGTQEVINLGEEHNYIPTSVFLRRDGQMCFGDEADERAADAPERYARGFKMKLGSDFPVLYCFNEGKPTGYTAEQLTSAFLRHVRQLCEERACFCTVKSAVITRPVDFSPAQVEELRRAARQAGFSVVTFVTEPEAAGYAFCVLSPEQAFQHTALVVDWGGGTLDMAVVARSADRVKTDREKTAGENMMGGEAFDARLWNYVVSEYVPRGVDLEAQSPAVRHAAHVQVRKAKEALSKRDLKKLSLTTDRGAIPALPVTRTEFEALIQQDVQKAVDMVQHLACGSQDDKPEMLLMVGGTSLIPLVRREMETQTGLPAKQWQYVREAVALGAALWNKQRQEKEPDTTTPAQETPQPEQAGSLYVQFRKHADVCLAYNNGAPAELQTAAEWYIRGHMAGDLNCSYILARCYICGMGVPRQYEAALEIAKYLQECQCPSGDALMGELCYTGKGVALDRASGALLLEKAVQNSQESVPYMDEDIRYLMLSNIAFVLNKREESLVWMQWYAQEPRAVFRRGMLARAMFRLMNWSLGDKVEDFRALLDEGRRQYDPFAMFFMGMALINPNTKIYESERETGIALIRQAVSIYPTTPMLKMLAGLTRGTEDDSRMWASAGLGWSLLPAAHELHCSVRVCGNRFGAAMRVYAYNVVEELIRQGRCDEIVCTPPPPVIIVKNDGASVISSLSVRICVPEQNYDRTFNVDKPILPGGFIDIEIAGVPLSPNVLVEVQSDGRRSLIDYGDLEIADVSKYVTLCGSRPPFELLYDRGFFGLFEVLAASHRSAENLAPSAMVQSGTQEATQGNCEQVDLNTIPLPDLCRLCGEAPPLLMYWQKGLVGGYKLIIHNKGCSRVSDINVIKQNGEFSKAPITLAACESATVGWAEFSDSCGISENEEFFIVCDGYLPLFARLSVTEHDDNRSGLKMAMDRGKSMFALGVDLIKSRF